MSLKSQVSDTFAQPLPPSILTKLTSLSAALSLSPSQLFESWEAHSLTRGIDALDETTFGAFETHLKNGAAKHNKLAVNTNTALGKRSAGSAGVTPSPAAKRPDGRSGLSAVDSLNTPSKSTPSKKAPAPGSAGSAAAVTPPKGAPSAAGYSSREGRGETLLSFNPSDFSDFESDGRRRCAISPSLRDGGRHGFAPLASRAKALEERWHRMNEAICARYGLKGEEETAEGEREEGEKAYWTPAGVPGQSGVVCVGRVCNEAHSGRLNSASLLLEGSRRHSSGSRISVDLPKDLSYSLFPGQIVAMEGMNSSGRIMRPVKIMEGAPPPRETTKASELMDFRRKQDGRPLKIIAMCGPYTTSDSLEYAPLLDAVLQIAERKPDAVVLCGPFVDSRHPLVEECAVEEDGALKKVSHEYLFRVRISELLMEMYDNYPELDTQLVLVPSAEDAFAESVYPQPPLWDAEVDTGMVEFGSLGLGDIDAGRGKEEKRVHCVSNPATLKINEVVIGVTSTDVLFHINCDSANANLPAAGRLGRIAQHLVQQRSYYPLFPAAKGACLDLSSSEKWEMPVQPDILIVPSKLNPFVKEVCESTVVVNPGMLTKNTTGGTYAVMDIYPTTKEKLEQGLKEDAELENAVQERIRVDIKRI